MSTKDLGDLGVAAGDIIDKAFTLGYETGRKYIPAGGMSLTAEQMEGLKFALEAVTSVADVVPELRGTLSTPVGRLVKFLRALFPATEPAEEETKAELCAVRLCLLPARHSGVHADREGLRGNNPTSSPVVPAPNETGPWKTCGHVPIGIVFRSKDRHPAFTWVNEGGSLLSVRNECEDGHFSDGEHCLPSMVDENFAPFVAAEEG